MAISIVNQSELSAKLHQIHALLNMTFGGQAEAFNGMSDHIKDTYLWAVSDLVVGCIDLIDAE